MNIPSKGVRIPFHDISCVHFLRYKKTCLTVLTPVSLHPHWLGRPRIEPLPQEWGAKHQLMILVEWVLRRWRLSLSVLFPAVGFWFHVKSVLLLVSCWYGICEQIVYYLWRTAFGSPVHPLLCCLDQCLLQIASWGIDTCLLRSIILWILHDLWVLLVCTQALFSIRLFALYKALLVFCHVHGPCQITMPSSCLAFRVPMMEQENQSYR